MGPQGSGKGTQAERIVKRYTIDYISTGDIFRKNVEERTELGRKAKEALDKGMLVADSVVNAMVFERLKGKKGFILDGFPRTVNQAKALEKKHALDNVILLDVPDEVSMQRLASRRQCSGCGRIFGIDVQPRKEGACDSCGGALEQRDDDTVDKIRIRLENYHKETEPLIAFYEKKGILTRIDGTKTIEGVFQDIVSGLKRKSRSTVA